MPFLLSEQELLRHDEKYEAFYSTFCTLAADYISSGISSGTCTRLLFILPLRIYRNTGKQLIACSVAASKEETELYCKACRILVTYLISRLQTQTSQKESNGSSTLTIKQLLLPIKALCTASSQLQRTEQFALIALMKNAKLPQHIKTSMSSKLNQ